MKSKHTPLLSLNIQHDYITLRTPNGNFTTSYSGAKSSGKLAAHPTAFKKLDEFVQNLPKDMQYGERMEQLLDPKVLEQFFPEWNEPLNVVAVGDRVKLIEAFSKKYPRPGIVKQVKRKTAYLELEDHPGKLIGFDMCFMEKINSIEEAIHNNSAYDRNDES